MNEKLKQLVVLIDEMEGFQKQGRILRNLKNKGFVSEPTYLIEENNAHMRFDATVRKIDKLHIDIFEAELFNLYVKEEA